MATKPSPVTDGKAWAKELVNLYSEGYSDAEVAAHMKITVREYYQQINENAVFGKLVEYGRTLALAWWEGQARQNVGNKAFNTPLWVFTMKNKYGWADRVETTATNENTNIDLDDLRAKVARQTSKYVALNHPELASVAKTLSNTVQEDVEDESV